MKIKCKPARAGVVAKYVHAKLDGHWVSITPGLVATSHPTDITHKLPLHIYEQAERLWAAGVPALGELWVPNKPASCVKTALKDGWGTLQLTLFAVPGVLDDDAPLEDVAGCIKSLGLEFAPYEAVAPVPVELGQGELDQLVMRARTAGLEGWVLKSGNLTGWHKLKCESSLDAVVTGVVEGEGKYLGQIGSLECSVWHRWGKEDLMIIANVSGMSDDARLDITMDFDDGKLLGRVVEIEYQRVDSGGRLRHPRFKCFRDDKRPEECDTLQDPDLAAHFERARRFCST